MTELARQVLDKELNQLRQQDIKRCAKMREAKDGNPPANSDQFVRGLRKQMGLTQRQFGRLFRVNEVSVSRWEHGIYRPMAMIWQRMQRMYAETRTAV